MRILISNPDGIGDLVLRQPLFAALLDAGHELALVVRSEAAPIVKWLAPGAQVFHLSENPFRPQFDVRSEAVEQLLRCAQEFGPDIYVIAPYQRTVFDELLAESLRGARGVGLDGYLYRGDIGVGLDLHSKLQMDVTVPVSIEMHELRKSELLCSALLGRTVSLPQPRIALAPEDLEPARARLTQLGLAPGRYWTACVGNGQHNAIRNWGLESWASLLSHFVEKHGHPILFTGTPDESQATEEIRSRMGGSARVTVNLCETGDSLEAIVGLTALSAGYIGRDTGPMHIAAALSKPVLAVFGAGNWPRFTPVARRGVVFTINLECAGCNFLCHLSDSYCIKRVPVADVIAGLDELERGDTTELQIRALEPDWQLNAHVIREAALLSSERQRRAAADRQQLTALRSQDTQHQNVIDQLREDLEQEERKCSAAVVERDLARNEATYFLGEIRRLEAKHDTEKQDFVSQLALVRRERQDAIEAGQRLSYKFRLAQIDAKTLRANEAREREQLLTLIGDCGRELQMLTVERDGLFRQLEEPPEKVDAERPAQVAPPELPLTNAFRIAIDRMSHARGRRLHEAMALAAAAGARFRRQFGLARNHARRD